MPIINVVAAIQVSETLKLVTGHTEDLHQSLMQFDVWRNEWRKINLGKPLPDCPTCGLGRYDSLLRSTGEFAAVLCGRNAVQVLPPKSTRLDFEQLAGRSTPTMFDLLKRSRF